MAKNTDADVLEITQIRSDIGAQQAQRRTLRALGLRRIRHTVSHPDRPEIRGMLARVAHLVEVRPAGETQKKDTQAAKPAKASTKKSSQRPKKKNDEDET